MKKHNLFISLLILVPVFLKAQQNEPENLGKNINTEYSELNPVMAPDGKTLYFGRKNHPENKFGKTGSDQIAGSQDIWFSEYTAGEWTAARRMPDNLNKIEYNTALSISPDGQTMLLRTPIMPGSGEQRSFSIAKKNGNNWGNPVKCNIKNYERMCKGKNDFAFMTNDGKAILLAFSEKKNSDEDDLYVSFLENDGTWSEPANLGPDINTNYTETTPFLAADGKTLYFSSNRKGGLGNNDIYVCKRKDETWGNWTEPQNIGEPINTEDYDAYYTIAAAGDYAYFVSAKNTMGKKDIYRLKLMKGPDEDAPTTTSAMGAGPPKKNNKTAGTNNSNTQKSEPVVMVIGKVRNSKTGQIPPEAKVIYEDLTNGKELGVATPDPITGIYKVVLPYGKNYGITAKADGFFGSSINMDLSKITGGYLEVDGKDISIAPIETGLKVTMNNIFFEFGKASLRPESFPELSRIAQFMTENTKLVIEIGGHTDNIGSDLANMKLSQERADVVRNYILSKVNIPTRITSKGYGESQPKASNDTEDGRQTNRRVEFSVLKN